MPPETGHNGDEVAARGEYRDRFEQAQGRRITPRVQEYWSWIAVALFLLVTVDMITTTYAAYQVGVIHESNPLVRWSLLQGPAIFLGINLAAVVLVTVLFDRVVDVLCRTPAPYDGYLAAGIEAWLGGLLAAGLLVFANNLAVIFFGQSLF